MREHRSICVHETFESIVAAAVEALRPPERLTATEMAEKYRFISNQVMVGKFTRTITPYTVDVQDTMSSGDYKYVIFVAPAQVGKTDIVFNVLLETAISSPTDFMIVEKNRDSANDLSVRRLDELFNNTPKLASLLLPGSRSRSIFRTRLRGMLLTVGYPTKNQLSGRPIGKLWLSDYDRMPMDMGGEGDPFTLASKRATTFRNALVVAESSPSYPLTDPKWKPDFPHQGPPVGGIVGLYNRGDMRRLYWQCVDCLEWFEPRFRNLKYDKSLPPAAASQTVELICPHCGGYYHNDGEVRDGVRRPGKKEMNLTARWVAEGQRLDKDGNLLGEAAHHSDTASFWMFGPAAAFVTWSELVKKYLDALEEYHKTSDDGPLKSTVNVDQGEVYVPIGLGKSRNSETFLERAEDLGERVVPEGVRFLVANIDTQKRHWVVQVHGIGVDGRMWVIDRFSIEFSDRRNEHGYPDRVEPHTYIEDWDMITSQVVEKSYPLGDDSGRRMGISMTTIDAFGVAGVTANAYEYWRSLKKLPGNVHKRVALTKGDPNDKAPLIRTTYPDSERKDRKAQARGGVPVTMICSTKAKDIVANLLNRDSDGPGHVKFPAWLEDWWYEELVAEEKGRSGRWEKPRGARNEAWDLIVYAYAICQSKSINLPRINWDTTDRWYSSWDTNEFVFDPEITNQLEKEPARDTMSQKLSNLGAQLA